MLAAQIELLNQPSIEMEMNEAIAAAQTGGAEEIKVILELKEVIRVFQDLLSVSLPPSSGASFASSKV